MKKQPKKKYNRIKITTGAYVSPEEAWRSLGVAIVRQAVVDWQETRLALSRPATMTHNVLDLHREAERFLLSPECEFYSNLDGKTLLRKMKGVSL